LKLWTKTVTKLEDGKKPASLPKKGNEQKLKIKNSLTALKRAAPAAKTDPAAFISERDKSALLLRKFCRYLKTTKDEDKKLTEKYLKTVMGLAVVVASLEPAKIDLNEDEGSLDDLNAQNTSALAAALEKPDTETEVEDKIEAPLKKPVPTDEKTDQAPKAKPEKAPSLVVLQQTRLAWDQTRKTIQAELQKLEKSILTTCKADADIGPIDVGILHSILRRLDTRLIDKLDQALNAADPGKRAALNLEAKGIVNEYLAFVNESPLMADIDDSGFVPVAIRTTAVAALNLLSSKL
jgi:hypothetical protein